jgi:hypothetical protein
MRRSEGEAEKQRRVMLRSFDEARSHRDPHARRRHRSLFLVFLEAPEARDRLRVAIAKARSVPPALSRGIKSSPPTTIQVVRTPHDALFKAGFESPLHAAALFQQVLPAELVDVIDWQSIRREAGSFIDPELASRHTDLLFSVELLDQGDQKARLVLYLLVEHQSTNDPDMPLRMLVYLVRIWETYHKLHGAPLPLIVPAIVSHAPEGWSTPTSFHALFEPPPDSIPHVARLVPSFAFLLTDLVRTTNEELRRWELPPFAITVLRYLRDGRHFDQLLQSMPEWIGPFERLARGPDRNLAALEQLLRYVLLV